MISSWLWFLSERAEFAQAVMVDAGLIWIGPSPERSINLGQDTGT